MTGSPSASMADVSKKASPPADNPPPDYDAATGGAASSAAGPSTSIASQGECSTSARASSDGNDRPLPPGWIRQWDSSHKHHFWVDTKASPPRSIWTHPLDDAAFLKANPQFAQKGAAGKQYAPPPTAPPGAAPAAQHGHSSSTSDETRRVREAGERAAQRAREKPAPSGMKKISRNMKDKSTGMDHVERARHKAEQREMEQIALEHRRKTAAAFFKAAQFGQAQYLGRDDRSGTEYWAEPPPPGFPPGLLTQFPPPYGFESRRDGPRTFVRPAAPAMTMGYRGGYGPMGGGGMGLPIAGGLLGGMMLGGLLF